LNGTQIRLIERIWTDLLRTDYIDFSQSYADFNAESRRVQYVDCVAILLKEFYNHYNMLNNNNLIHPAFKKSQRNSAQPFAQLCG